MNIDSREHNDFINSQDVLNSTKNAIFHLSYCQIATQSMSASTSQCLPYVM